MKRIITVLATVLAVFVGGYQLALFIMPSITLKNGATLAVQSASVALPNNFLDFGAIDSGTTNRIHYSLEQADGAYHYQIVFTDGTGLSGACGYVTHNEVNKRVVIEITTEREVECRSSL